MSEKIYLYHKVPKEMKGTILYPLNQLRDIFPEIYDAEVKKYEHRESILERRIPILGCLWNDVLHLSPVHPQQIKDALLKLGYHDFEYKFYQLDADSINPSEAVIYTYEHAQPLGGVDVKDFIPYTKDKISTLNNITETTTKYFQDKLSRGEEPLLFYGVPHILVKHNIDITDVPIIGTV